MILQTANGLALDEKERKCEEINILLDNCYQQTFISEKIVRKLGLIPINEINRNISAFGSEKGAGRLLKEYNIVVQPTDRSR